VLGRKYGRSFPKISEAIKTLDDESIAKLAKGESVTVVVDGTPVEVQREEVELRSVPKDDYSVVEEHEMLVGVHTVLTDDLESEGLARDIVRRIQALRKEADFEIDDHIVVYYLGSSEVEAVFNDESEYISAETLSDELVNGKAPKEAKVQDYEIDGLMVKLGLIKK
jgi:isoleucyl-tRNA synthetase